MLCRMSTIDAINDVTNGARNEHHVHDDNDITYEEYVHVNGHEERMERLENVSSMLAELVHDSRKKKDVSGNESATMFKNFSSLNPPS